MQLVVNIKDQSIVDKIVQLLKIFENDGVEISYPEKQQSLVQKDHEENVKETIPNWQEELMTHEDPNTDDDEILPEAYVEYKSEKHTAR